MFRTDRRQVASAVLAAAVLTLAACGGDDDDTADTSDLSLEEATSTTTAGPTTTTTIAKPEVSLPAEAPTELGISDLQPGTGPEAAEGDTVLVYYVGVLSKNGTEFDNNYESGQLFPVTLGQGGVIEGWQQGLVGIRTDGVRQLDIPAELGYGDQGSGEIIKPGDALSFVIEAKAVIPATRPQDEPTPEIATSTGATDVVVEDAIAGGGAALEDGQTMRFHLMAYRGDTGDMLDSTWRAQPAEAQYARATLQPAGFYEGLEGMLVGGRRIITIPAAKAFGEEGNAAISLPPSTDLILVVDLFAAY